MYYLNSLNLLLQTVLLGVMLLGDVNILTSFNTNIFNNFININPLSFRLDSLSISFLLVVYIISLAVTTYQFAYIGDSFNKTRFFIQLNWFVISMVFVLVSAN